MPVGDMLFDPELWVLIVFYIPNKLKVPPAQKVKFPPCSEHGIFCYMCEIYATLTQFSTVDFKLIRNEYRLRGQLLQIE